MSPNQVHTSKLADLVASFLNTLLSAILLVTAWYDMKIVFQLRWMFVSDSVTDGLIINLILFALWYFVVWIVLALLGNALRLHTAGTYPYLTTFNSEDFKDELRQQCFGVCFISWFTALAKLVNTLYYLDEDDGPGHNFLGFGKQLSNFTRKDITLDEDIVITDFIE